MSVFAGKKSDAVLEYLSGRRSVKVDQLTEPGPVEEQLREMLKIAARVPDHGKMCPWYFLVFQGKAREKAGDILAAAYQNANPDAREDKIEKERERFLRAPVVVAVISRVRKGKNPVWEQVLSAGAMCMNLLWAVNAQGFGAQWLTEWYAYDENVKRDLGLDARDHVAGFIYIGTVAEQPEERERPDLDKFVNFWSQEKPLLKGDDEDRQKFGFPEDGFDFEKARKED